MEPLGAAASIAGLIHITLKIGIYIKDVSGATKARGQLRIAVRGCGNLLQQLLDEAEDAEPGSGWTETIKALEGPGTPIDRLSVSLGLVQAKLEGKGFRSSLKWPFTEKEVTELLSAIEREKALLNLALAGDTGRLVHEIKKSTDENATQLKEMIKQFSDTSKNEFEALRESHASLFDLISRMLESVHPGPEADPLAWLSCDNYQVQYAEYISRRQEGTGAWLLESEEFETWIATDTETPVLFCPGPPGAGKTTLAATVVEYLRLKFQDQDDTIVTHLYCNFRHRQKTEHMLAGLAKQLLSDPSRPPENLEKLRKQCQDERRQPRLGEAADLIRSSMPLYARVFVIVDALDECVETDGNQEHLLSQLLQLQSQCKFRLFATSRPIPRIQARFQDPNIAKLEIRATEHDIRMYVEANLSRLPSFVSKDGLLQEEIKKSILSSTDGMFLLAKLHLDSMVGQRSPKALRKALKHLPNPGEGYDRSYGDAMARIEAQLATQTELAKQALAWITLSRRPLSEKELLTALAVEPGSYKFDNDNIPAISDVIGYCAGLVTVLGEGQTVSLVHYTTQEYLQRTIEQWYKEANIYITETCLTYLLYDDLGGSLRAGKEKEDLSARSQNYCLYSYATGEWGHHARVATENAASWRLDEVWKKTASLVEAFLRDKNRLFIARRSFRNDITSSWEMHSFLDAETALNLTAFFGLAKIMEGFLSEETDLEAQDSEGWAPLHWATAFGRASAAEVLIRHGANIEAMDGNRLSPMHAACGAYGKIQSDAQGRAQILQLLLQQGADVHIKGRKGRTPLHTAAEIGDETAARTLLQAGASIEARDEDGKTPIFLAVYRGLIDMARMLADKGADIFIQAKGGRTLLHESAANDDFLSTKYLLESGLDVNSKTDIGMTPLHFTETLPISKLLLEFGADLSATNWQGKTPFQWCFDTVVPIAVIWGFLIGKPFIQEYVAALHTATLYNREAEIKRLLEQGPRIPMDDVHIRQFGSRVLSRPDLRLQKKEIAPFLSEMEFQLTWGFQSALVLAIQQGRHEASMLLLNRVSRTDFVANRKGQTLLHLVALAGDLTLLTALLNREGLRLDVKDSTYRTALSYAAELGHEAMVKALLETDKVDPTLGALPLGWQAATDRKGHTFFLDHNTKSTTVSEPQYSEHKRSTPRDFALQNGHTRIAELLAQFLDSASNRDG